MSDDSKISYIIEVAPVVEELLKEYSSYNQVTSYLLLASFILFLYFSFSPQAVINNIKANLNNRLTKRKILGYLVHHFNEIDG